jgi:acyl-CoA reductase-like NAD-dependent aldehyde dehydrogenase
VLKPAEQSPLSALELAEISAEVGLPEGVLNVVTGFGGGCGGEEAGEALVCHPLVRGISFTSSLDAGRRIMAAAEGVKPLALELGGKNPILVFEDADLNRAVDDAIEAAFDNAGQICSSASRLLLQRPIEAAFVEHFETRAEELRIGPGRDDSDLARSPSRSSTKR